MSYVIVALVSFVLGIFAHKHYALTANEEVAKLREKLPHV